MYITIGYTKKSCLHGEKEIWLIYCQGNHGDWPVEGIGGEQAIVYIIEPSGKVRKLEFSKDPPWESTCPLKRAEKWGAIQEAVVFKYVTEKDKLKNLLKDHPEFFAVIPLRRAFEEQLERMGKE